LCCLPQGAAPRGPTRLETEWLHLPIQDGGRGEHELESALAVALPFIRRRRECGAVLVHCAAGMSRSVAVAAAVLCEDGLGLREALQQIAEAKARALGLPAGRANEAIAVARELRACLERLYGTVARR
jgi:protein-tyrosine phosphatase